MTSTKLQNKIEKVIRNYRGGRCRETDLRSFRIRDKAEKDHEFLISEGE